MLFKSTNNNAFIYYALITFMLYSNLLIKAHADDIRIVSPRSNNYYVELTRLVLSKNEHLYPKSKLILIDASDITLGKKLVLLKRNDADVIWAGANAEREFKYLPVRIPLFRGLLGYRVLLIRQEDKDKFLQIKKPAELKKLIACQGSHWVDSDILEANGYSVSRVEDFNTLLKMLVKKRCDYFPRAIFEANSDLKKAIKYFPNITLMDDLILHYDLPAYYFVKKNNVALAHRLEQGLLAAFADGSFMKLMKKHKEFKYLFPLSKWNDKRYFELSSDILRDGSPIEKNKFWFDLQGK